jgi:hypothetical protein
MRQYRLHALVVGVLIVAGGAALASAPGAPVAQQTGDITRSVDELWADIGKMVPEFGGFFHSEEQHALMMYVTAQRPGIAEDLRTALESVFNQASLDGLYLDNIVLLDARYSMLQLIDWRDRMREGGMFAVPGVTSFGFREFKNRLGIYVEHPDERSTAAEEKLDELGIPREAVIIEGKCLELLGGTSPDLCDRSQGAVPSGKAGRVAWRLGGAGALILIAVVVRMVLVRRPRTSSAEGTG